MGIIDTLVKTITGERAGERAGEHVGEYEKSAINLAVGMAGGAIGGAAVAALTPVIMEAAKGAVSLGSAAITNSTGSVPLEHFVNTTPGLNAATNAMAFDLQQANAGAGLVRST